MSNRPNGLRPAGTRGFPPAIHPVQVQIPLNQTSVLTCSNCGEGKLIPLVMMLQVPSIVSPTGQELYAKQDAGALCPKCGAELDQTKAGKENFATFMERKKTEPGPAGVLHTHEPEEDPCQQ